MAMFRSLLEGSVGLDSIFSTLGGLVVSIPLGLARLDGSMTSLVRARTLDPPNFFGLVISLVVAVLLVACGIILTILFCVPIMLAIAA